MEFVYPVIANAVSTAEAAEQSGFNIYTYVISLINILFLFYLLKTILFKPITNILNQRTERIRKDLEDAKNNTEKATQLKFQYEEQLKNLKYEGDMIIENSEEKAKVKATEILDEAKRQADYILEKAAERGEREIQLALSDIKNQVATLSLQAASKILEKNMNNEENKKLVEQFLDEVGVA